MLSIMPFEQVSYDLLNSIGHDVTGKEVQGKGLAGKLLDAARKELITPDHHQPLSDTDLLDFYNRYAKPELRKVRFKGLGHQAYVLLEEYLIQRNIIKPSTSDKSNERTSNNHS